MSTTSEQPNQINPPFGFASVTALDANTRLKPWADVKIPEVFASAHALPVCLGESHEAARSFPLVFGGGDTLMAVLGLEKDENLFMHGGAWEGAAYMPAALRRYPFCSSNVRIDGVLQDQALICVESSFVAEDGAPIVDANGQATPEFAERSQFVQSLDADLRNTMRLVNYLGKLGLLKEFTVTAKLPDGSDFQLGGMLRVDLEVLRVQPAKDLRALIENGGMALIYTHLNSLPNFDRLLARKFPPLPVDANKTAPA